MGRNHWNGQILFLRDQEQLLHYKVGMTGQKELDATLGQYGHDIEQLGNRHGMQGRFRLIDKND